MPFLLFVCHASLTWGPLLALLQKRELNSLTLIPKASSISQFNTSCVTLVSPVSLQAAVWAERILQSSLLIMCEWWPCSIWVWASAHSGSSEHPIQLPATHNRTAELQRQSYHMDFTQPSRICLGVGSSYVLVMVFPLAWVRITLQTSYCIEDLCLKAQSRLVWDTSSRQQVSKAMAKTDVCGKIYEVVKPSLE